MLSLVLVSVHNKCGHIRLGSLFQVWIPVPSLDAEDDPLAYDRGNNLLFVHYR